MNGNGLRGREREPTREGGTKMRSVLLAVVLAVSGPALLSAEDGKGTLPPEVFG